MWSRESRVSSRGSSSKHKCLCLAVVDSTSISMSMHSKLKHQFPCFLQFSVLSEVVVALPIFSAVQSSVFLLTSPFRAVRKKAEVSLNFLPTLLPSSRARLGRSFVCTLPFRLPSRLSVPLHFASRREASRIRNSL